MEKRQKWLSCVVALLALAMGSINARAQAGIGVLHSFTNLTTDGSTPEGPPLLIGTKLYGTTYYGGSSLNGTVYQVGTNGTGFGLIYSFLGGANGANPLGTLVSTGSTLYGMTFNGGVNDGGVVFGLDTNGPSYKVLHTFLGGSSDGFSPFGSLIITGSTLYGMTANGGTNDAGVVFKISTNGTSFSVLHSFAGAPNDGASPSEGVILQGTTLYGTTFFGGSNDLGTVFALDTAATSNAFKILHHFAGMPNDGANPSGPLTLLGSSLFGITTAGGSTNFGVIFKVDTNGANFAVLHHFLGGTNDGALPQFGPLAALDSVLYGVAESGGAFARGVLFQIGANGSGFTIVHSFSTNANDGAFPVFGPIVGGSSLYGTTIDGGSNNLGVVYGAPATPGTNAGPCKIVPATNETGVSFGTITAGSNYTFTATGTASYDCASGNFVDADGNPWGPLLGSNNWTCATLRPLSLVGKVNGTCIQLGTSGTFVAPSTGELFALMNDSVAGFFNNCGEWNVCITPVTCPGTNILTEISAIQIVNTNVVITIPTVVCEMYQLQYSAEMVPTNWINTGASQAGTGGPIQFIAPLNLCPPQATCLPPPSGLVSWWPGDGHALDMVGGNNGTLANGATFVDGKVCQAFSFTNNHAGVLIGNPTNLHLSTFTIELWFRLHDTTQLTTDPACTGNGHMFNTGSEGYGFVIINSSAGHNVLCLTQVDFNYVTGGPSITDTNWHHAAVSWSGTTAVFYLDGVSYASSACSTPPCFNFTFTTPAGIGILSYSIHVPGTTDVCSFNGDIDEVSVYNRVLSPAEIASIYNAGAAGKCKPLIPNHRFYRVDEFP